MRKKEKDTLVYQVAEEIYAHYPHLWERFGQNGRDRTEEDNHHHLDHLSAAYEMDSVDFFIDYTTWLNNVLTSRGVGTFLIVDNFERLARLINDMECEDEKEQQSFIEYLQKALQHLETFPSKR
ncbi:hypothetical protein H0266_12505 [Halobacillus locisalis]|uniref:Uncharacterized protein n=1 Tax=Halobacillus locisalis TaxID=220753 RepID=A0A838CUU3_9BACI|nr:hypothetical protein [Halobacillus locisalis]MBA2175714.1 hypothetical protein [Halobacillus locisalis]